MKNEIDLSKVYAGQIVTLKGLGEVLISSISKSEDEESEDEYEIYFANQWYRTYSKDGVYIGKKDRSENDIISIQDPIQVQCARIEGEIKGITETLESVRNKEWKILADRQHNLKQQLLTLQNNQ